jgi:hypothetical protein
MRKTWSPDEKFLEYKKIQDVAPRGGKRFNTKHRSIRKRFNTKRKGLKKSFRKLKSKKRR